MQMFQFFIYFISVVIITTLPQNPLNVKRLEDVKNSISQQSRIAKLNNKDFIFDFLHATTGVSRGTGGRTVSASSSNFPGAIGNGIAMTVAYLGPCGINLPHTHPRATEINFSVQGTFQVGFFQENNARFVMNTVKPGTAAVFPKGAIHFEQNLDCTPAIFVAAFNDEDPGVLTIADGFFGALPATIVGASLNGRLNIKTINDIKMALPKNPALGIEECKKRCGIKG